jgi:uncharacterized protein
MARPLHLALLEGDFAVFRLPPTASTVDLWALLSAQESPLVSVSRTCDEISVVAPETLVSALEERGARCERGWRAFHVVGPLPFDAVGILASITGPLADASISLFSISTFDTDYVLVKDSSLGNVRKVLTAAGHSWSASVSTHS